MNKLKKNTASIFGIDISRSMPTLKMEAIYFAESLVYIYQTTRHQNPEDNNVRIAAVLDK